jgi:flagellar hook-length control protein FliK
MTFDINPMQSTASPIALLAGLQGGASASDFAALLSGEVLPERSGEQAEPTGEKVALSTTAVLPPAGETPAAPVATAMAIAHADALFATLAPAPERTEAPAEPKVFTPAQIALPVAARTITRRDAPQSLPKDETNDDRPEAKPESDEVRRSTPAIVMALPETVGVQRPADGPSPSLEHEKSAPLDGASLPEKKPEMADRALLPEKTERKIGHTLQDEQHEPARPVRIETKVFAIEPAKADRPAHIERPVSPSSQPTTMPKAPLVRSAKIAEIALGLADQLPDPTVAAIHKQVADLPVARPEAAAPAAATPVTLTDMVIDRQLDLFRNEQWLGELAHDIASTSGDNNRLSFRLMPHQLGRLDVDVTRSHNGLSLAIHTESDSAQAILSAAQPRLADEIRAQGLKLADTQMFSGDARHSPGHDGHSRPAPLIETFTTYIDTVDTPEPEQRDGRYA